MTSRFQMIPASVAAALALAVSVHAQTAPVVRNTEIRVDKVPTASILFAVPAETNLQILSLEGGWAQVEWQGKTGWVRASALRMDAGISQAATVRAERA